MAKRLVKIAKELNVGTSTIVDYLNGVGYEVENKPTYKITPEMENKLLQEFQGSLAIKKEADKLEIGVNRSPTEEKKVVKVVPSPKISFGSTNKVSLGSPKVELSKPKPPVVLKPEPKVEAPVEKPVEPVSEAPKLEEVVKSDPKPEAKKPEIKKAEESAKPKLKILGKIDLDARKKKPRPVKKDPPKRENKPAPKARVENRKPEQKKFVAPTTKKEDTKPPVTSTPTVEGKSEKTTPKKDDGVIRADAPQLKGLKILGKIDTNKFNRPKKKDTSKSGDNKSKSGDKKPGEKKPGESGDAKKRRRKRKTVVRTVGNTGGTGGGTNRPPRGRAQRGKSKKDQPKEVSKKEIEDQIKATMARISGGGKNKRQKMRRDNRLQKREKKELQEMENDSTGTLQVTEFISVSELASLMDVSASQVITTCMNLGYFVTLNQRLDAEVIEIVASEFEYKIEFISAEEQLELEEDDQEEEDAPEDLESRSPIVTVMGHVDHGKTSLLDYIRRASVAEGEAGGITQHIGAYEVNVNGKKVTFLDTPGHEAFTAMRARGAKVTDVAIIIVAADDNIMPQTKEAISHAQAAEVPMVFAINKIDKDGASPDRIKQELSGMNLLVEEWGGTFQSQDISAKMGTGIDSLLEKIILEAEMLDLKANPNKKGIGVVLEASLDKGRGYVAKTLVQAGTLKIGDPVVAGEYSGKVKAMFNEHGKRVTSAGPSSPVLVLGLNGAPTAGEKFKEMESEQEARQLATKRSQINREQANRASRRISLDEIGRRLALGTFKELNLIIKGDVDGSIEALTDSLLKLSIETVQVNVIHKAVGQIIESDVLLASASDAIIIGFQVRPSSNARKLAEREGVEIKSYSIIYEAIEEIKSAIEGMLEPTKEERVTAEVQIRETFKISRVGTVAGCFVTDGKIARNDYIRVVRDGIVVYPNKEGMKGEVSSLKRFKEDVKEVRSNFECGITVKNFNDLKAGDIIESYEIVEVKQKLS